MMGRIMIEVRAPLLQEQQDRRKTELDAHWRNVRFVMGDEVLLHTDHAPLPSRSLLFPRWMGPFKVLASRVACRQCPAPDTCRLDDMSQCLSDVAVWHVCPEFNVECLLPVPARRAGPARCQCRRGSGGAGGHRVQERLLKFQMCYGRPHELVRWAGRDASGDTWSGAAGAADQL
jgi:hypothetical protein